MQRYTRGFTEHLSRCDLAILQAGSTPFQILESDVPILLYSRDYSTQEQQVRAERLESFPGIGRLAPADMEPETLAGRIRDALAQPRTPRQTGFGFDGAATAARTIVELLGKKDPERA
jgi:predicted glycosyltransferase